VRLHGVTAYLPPFTPFCLGRLIRSLSGRLRRRGGVSEHAKDRRTNLLDHLRSAKNAHWS